MHPHPRMGQRLVTMTTHTFTLIVNGPDLQSDERIGDVYEAGCDDALIGRADGIQYADFDREADSFQYAVLTAVAELESISGVNVVRLADAGLVSMADIAARTGRIARACGSLSLASADPADSHPPSLTSQPLPALAQRRSAALAREKPHTLLNDAAADLSSRLNQPRTRATTSPSHDDLAPSNSCRQLTNTNDSARRSID